jgi:sortase (surface protein transpeptidase)
LEIPALGVKTGVEHVGQTKTHEMDVPKDAAQVAWYVYGAKPGEEGNAVISGHFDTPSGKPAVFYSLRSISVGDKIIINSDDGNQTTFIVREKKLYPYTTFPSEFVFHTKPGKNLNLITCAGIWDKKDKIYNQRMVVFSVLDEGGK